MITINLGKRQNIGLDIHTIQKAAKMSYFKALNKTFTKTLLCWLHLMLVKTKRGKMCPKIHV